MTPPPELLKKNPGLVSFMKEYDVPSGDSTFDIELNGGIGDRNYQPTRIIPPRSSEYGTQESE